MKMEKSTGQKHPLVSILILSYNAESFIKEAIDSALTQTWTNFEVIVLDNGSSDGTAGILRSYNDPHLKCLYEDKNLDVVLGRNRLLREAHGEFLTWLDGDDSYLPRKVEREADFLLDHPETLAVYCDTYYFFEEEPGQWYRNVNQHYSGDIFEPLLDRIFINNTAFMMRRAVIEQLGYFNPATGIVEDWEYFLRMAYHGVRFGYLNEKLLKCRLRENSASGLMRKSQSKESIVAIFENLRVQMSNEERRRYRMDERICGRYRELAIAYLSAGRKKEFYEAWWKGSTSLSQRIFAACICAVTYVLPAAWFMWIIKAMARIKKKSNYEYILSSPVEV